MPAMRVALAMVAVLSWVGTSTAFAQKTFPVVIESTPPGATLYIDDKTEGPVGVTPYEGRLTAGSHVLVLELEGHETVIEDVRVRAQGKPQTFAVELSALPSVPVEVVSPPGDLADGAPVLLDGREVGRVPTTIEVTVGPHQIQVVVEGRKPFEEWIEVVAGEPATVSVRLGPRAQVAAVTPPPAAVTKSATPEVEPTRLHLMAGGRLGWRSFRYEAPRSGPLRPFDANWVGMLRLDAELHPALGWDSVPVLRRVIVSGSLSRAFPLEASTQSGMEAIQTIWNEYDLGATVRFPFEDGASIDVDLAYGRTLFTFRDAGELADELPDVDYQYLRVGAEALKREGRAALFAGFDVLAPLSTGPLADRFGGATVLGFSIRAGAMVQVWGDLYAYGGASWTRFSYGFDSAPGATYDADGGSDTMYGATLSAAYIY